MFAHLIENTTANGARTTVDVFTATGDLSISSKPTVVRFETLHRLTDKHPGFAYFAGLPGHLGLTCADHFNWITNGDVQLYWTELQRLCGVRCVVVGRNGGQAFGRSTGLQSGLIATVSRAIGTKSSSTSSSEPAVATPTAISPFGSTVAITASEEMWRGMSPSVRSLLGTAAALYRRQERANRNEPLAQRPQSEFTQVINLIAEATVAECANHDALTRRINASYFAFRDRQNAHVSKNSI
jgi:hypothetical protein